MKDKKYSTQETASKLAKCLLEKLHALAKDRLLSNKEKAPDIVGDVISSNNASRSDDGGVESSVSIMNEPS